ncbi:uncharacterized protein BDZ99DRAFT_510762 [Mytilinidion resinicola]|uniref:Ribosomal RNA methyltransferase FtsJ domain-containing protein n=1 Tax=Mytilinidion resinicola TaxID=574789 RepID=A0A6A6YD01_9PEZI|nr:uncharacterized protein BDZ99DRAFT_510762 [Mytilinidion resinicola]KAF2806479.1 hypothetical protein BDZ99DRAFT_510762 [Mytilinidion resinicola]
MLQNEMLDDVDCSLSPGTAAVQTPNSIVEEYLLRHVAVFKELMKLKRRGWENPKGDDFFKEQRIRADHADASGQSVFYNMMCQIGAELNNNTSALLLSSAIGGRPSVLDLCMAPGGFTASVLKENRSARVCGISLPLSQGGYKILLPNWQTDSRIQVCFLDITMLAAEMGITDIPAEHPDAANFLSDRPFHGEKFDLIFCDGQVLRMHSRAEYRERREAWRLVNGKIVALLHRLDAWDTVALLHTLSKFSSLQLFKPRKKHAIRSSFYVVAEQVQSQSVDALQAVATWKKEWYVATFGSDAGHLEARLGPYSDVDDPVWRIQGAALRRASFLP